MNLVLATLAQTKAQLPQNASEAPSPLITAAVHTLISSPTALVNAVTLTQPVSSPGEAAAITAAVRLLAFEHHLAVEVSDRSGRLRLRLARRAGQQGSPDAEE